MKKRLRDGLGALVLVVWLGAAACSTPSGGGEDLGSRRGVGVSGMRIEAIRSSLVGFMSDQDYELVDSDRRTLDFDTAPSRWTALRHGSFVNPETFVRMRIFVMEVGAADYWVGYEPLVVTERGTGFESTKPLKGKVPATMQGLLNQWKAELVPAP